MEQRKMKTIGMFLLNHLFNFLVLIGVALFVGNKVVSELNQVQKGRIDTNFKSQQEAILALKNNQEKMVEKLNEKGIEIAPGEVPSPDIIEASIWEEKHRKLASMNRRGAASVDITESRVPKEEKRSPAAMDGGSVALGRGCTHESQAFRCVRYRGNHGEAGVVIVDIPGAHPFLGEKLSVMVRGAQFPDIKSKDKCERLKAEKSKKLVSRLLGKDERIDLENVRRGTEFGTDFQLVADIVFDGKSLGDRLVRKGLARRNGKKGGGWCE